MVRYAEWNLSERKRWPASRIVTLITSSLPALAFLLATLIPGFGLYQYWAPMVVIVFTVPWTLNSRMKKQVGALRDLPASVDQFAVTTLLSRDGMTYGNDLGLVTFVEGWLHFEGQHSSFSLPAPQSWITFGDYKIPFDGPSGKHSVSFFPHERKTVFESAFASWIASRPPGDLSAPLPPVVPDSRLIYGAENSLAGFFLSASLLGTLILTTDLILNCLAIPLALFALGCGYRFVRKLDEHRRLRAGLPSRRWMI